MDSSSKAPLSFVTPLRTTLDFTGAPSPTAEAVTRPAYTWRNKVRRTFKILNSLRSFKRLKLILFIMTSTACQELFCTRLSEACCARQTIVITTTNPCNPWKYFRRILSAPAADWNFCDNYCHSRDNSDAAALSEQNKSALRAQRG